MTRVPIGSTTDPGPGEAYGPLYRKRFELIHQGLCAEEIARRWEVTREEMDRVRARVASACGRGHEEREVHRRARPPGGPDPRRPGGHRRTSLLGRGDPQRFEHREARRHFAPAFIENGTVTAGSSSQISDGAAAILIMSEEKADELGPQATSAVPHIRRCGQRPRDHAHGGHPGDTPRSREGEARDRGHRRHRDKRGLRFGRPRMAARARPGHAEGQPQRWCDRDRPSDGCFRCRG